MEETRPKICQRCFNEIPAGLESCPDCDEWSVFDVTEASIQNIMRTLREMPQGKRHSWFMFAPNSDDTKDWSGLIIKASRPLVWTSLRSERLRVPGDRLCGETHVDMQSSDLARVEKYIRRWTSWLQRKWTGYPGPEARRKRRLEEMDYQWTHS